MLLRIGDSLEWIKNQNSLNPHSDPMQRLTMQMRKLRLGGAKPLVQGITAVVGRIHLCCVEGLLFYSQFCLTKAEVAKL